MAEDPQEEEKLSRASCHHCRRIRLSVRFACLLFGVSGRKARLPIGQPCLTDAT